MFKTFILALSTASTLATPSFAAPAPVEAHGSLQAVDHVTINYWRDSIGTRDDPRVGQKPPARHARNIRAPFLLIHGANDSVVPFAQSLMMANALAAAGAPHQLVTLESEDHWLSSSATRIRMLAEIEKFLAANLAGGAAK